MEKNLNQKKDSVKHYQKEEKCSPRDKKEVDMESMDMEGMEYHLD